MHFIKIILLLPITSFLVLLTFSIPANSATYFIRTDGGTAQECTGLADTPYSGSGTNQHCAWKHPFYALPPGNSPRIAGGDTLIISSGSYKMGYDAPGDDGCGAPGTWLCHMPPVPSGPDATHPTRILGEGWDSGCATPPELWGTERTEVIINLTDSSNIEIGCLEITDHSGCVDFHSGSIACERDTYPYGNWAAIGIYSEDSSNAYLHDLNIHGLANTGIMAGRLTDWTVENVRIAGNGWVGWNGDLAGNDANHGTLTFRHWTVEWNGCGETYPDGQPSDCWAQTAGGYGDGVGTGTTGGNWVIEDSIISHNTSDGLDLLYHIEGGTVTLNRVRAEGNSGNQIKVAGQTSITNSVLIGNCGFFHGKSFTYNVDPCRALGTTVSLHTVTGGEQFSIINSTIYGQGDGLLYIEPRVGICNGSEKIEVHNSIFLGDVDYHDPGDISFLFYSENCGNIKLNSDFNNIYNAKNITCGNIGDWVNSGINDICTAPNLAGPFNGNNYGMTLTQSSPALDAGNNSACPSVDLNGHVRPADGDGDDSAICDMGAYEYGSQPAPPEPPPLADSKGLPWLLLLMENL